MKFPAFSIDTKEVKSYKKLMNEIEWTRKAAKQLVGLPQKVQDADDYRLRVGRYRVIFLIHPNGEITVFKIIEVKKRDENTY